MRTFMMALAGYVVLAAVTGMVYVGVSATATEVYSLESARVGHDNPVDGRLGWTEDD